MVAAALAAGPVPGRRAGQASPATGTPCLATSEAETEALARRYVEERWTDPDVLDALLAEDAVVHRAVGTGPLTAAEAQQRAGEFRAAFPDVQVSVGRTVVQGDAAAVAWVAEGTHRGEFDGVAATGRRAVWEGITIVRVACGRIAEVWNSTERPRPARRVVVAAGPGALSHRPGRAARSPAGLPHRLRRLRLRQQ